MPENSKQSYHSEKLHVYGFKRIRDDQDDDNDDERYKVVPTNINVSDIPVESKHNNPNSPYSIHFFPFSQCEEVSMKYVLGLFKLSEKNAQFDPFYYSRDPYNIGKLTDFEMYKNYESFQNSCKRVFPDVDNVHIDQVFEWTIQINEIYYETEVVLMGTVAKESVFYAILREDIEGEYSENGGPIIDSCWFDSSCTYQEGDGGTREHAYRDENADYLLIDNSGDVSSIVIIEKKRDD